MNKKKIITLNLFIYARYEYPYRRLRTDYQPPIQTEIERGGHRAILYRQEADPQSPFTDLQTRSKKIKKFAIISRVPTPDSTYYPIPYYAALFKGKWFNIKQLIGIAKEAKLKNSAPIKYNIEIANSFWNNIFKVEGITDREYPIPSIIDIVNSIRLAKGNVFAEWKQSDTARLFKDHGYKNKKESAGYFF